MAPPQDWLGYRYGVILLPPPGRKPVCFIYLRETKKMEMVNNTNYLLKLSLKINLKYFKTQNCYKFTSMINILNFLKFNIPLSYICMTYK